MSENILNCTLKRKSVYHSLKVFLVAVFSESLSTFSLLICFFPERIFIYAAEVFLSFKVNSVPFHNPFFTDLHKSIVLFLTP